MNIDDFQTQALKSVAIKDKNIAALAHRTLGLVGEAGILSNRVKKVIRDKDGKADAQDVEEITKRLGDVLYYAAVLGEYFDIKLSDAASKNLKQSEDFRKSREA